MVQASHSRQAAQSPPKPFGRLALVLALQAASRQPSLSYEMLYTDTYPLIKPLSFLLQRLPSSGFPFHSRLSSLLRELVPEMTLLAARAASVFEEMAADVLVFPIGVLAL